MSEEDLKEFEELDAEEYGQVADIITNIIDTFENKDEFDHEEYIKRVKEYVRKDENGNFYIVYKDDKTADYIPIRQGNGTNNFFNINNNDMVVKDNGIENVKEYISNEYALDIRNFKTLDKRHQKITTKTRKLFLMILKEANECIPYKADNDTLVVKRHIKISWEEWQRVCNYSNIKDVRKDLNKELDFLRSLYIRFNTKIGDKPNYNMFLIDGIGETIDGGRILSLNIDYANYLSRCFICYLPYNKLLELNTKYAFDIGYKLYLHFNMNYGRNNNYNILSVETIINNCLDIDAGGKNFKRDVFDRIETALDTLKEQGILSSWEFCNGKKDNKIIPLDANQLNNITTKNIFETLYIAFELPANFKGYEPIQALLTDRKKPTKKRRNAKKKQAEA